MAEATSETTSTISTIPTVLKVTNSKSHSYSIQIMTIRLNENNFLQWSQAVRMYIRGRGKISYLTGDKKELAKTDAAYATWDVENSMIIAWLINAMEEDISANYVLFNC